MFFINQKSVVGGAEQGQLARAISVWPQETAWKVSGNWAKSLWGEEGSRNIIQSSVQGHQSRL